MIEVIVEQSDATSDVFLLCLQDYTTSTSDMEAFICTRDDLRIIRTRIDAALESIA